MHAYMYCHISFTQSLCVMKIRFEVTTNMEKPALENPIKTNTGKKLLSKSFPFQATEQFDDKCISTR